MDDISEKLTSVLNDPASMDQIRSIAESLMGNQGGEVSANKKADDDFDIKSLINGVSPEQLNGIVKVMNTFNNNSGDRRTSLLLALRPYLSHTRQDRLDKAVKLLKIAKIMPLISDSGLFKL